MGKVEVLMANDDRGAERWTALVESSATPDVYYLPEYASATAEIEKTEPLALIAGISSCRMLAPLLLRQNSAPVNAASTEWLDAATPYGYGGLVRLPATEAFHPDHFLCFVEQLNAWCVSQQVVCCILRLHPLMEQQDWFGAGNHWEERWGERLQIHSRGTTSSIELSAWDEKLDQPASLRRDRRADMRLASRSLHVTMSTGEDEDAETKLGIFSNLYERLIARNITDSFYRFPLPYFLRLRRLGARLGIALAWHGDEPVGGNLFLAGPRYAHGHLAATNEVGRRNGASTLLIVEGARWARQRGCELLHLGGGMKPGDTLEDFKRSFGGASHVYRYITFIADRRRFDEISRLPTASWPYNLHDPSSLLENRSAT